MMRPRAADDFAAIRARIEELRREREGVAEAEDPPDRVRRDAERSLSARVQLDLMRHRRRS